jgi:hypothetical protein
MRVSWVNVMVVAFLRIKDTRMYSTQFPNSEQPWWQHDSIHEPLTTYMPFFYAVERFKS